jgi:beta-lactamase regulating signal transducer with metallopeptidase domain
MMTHFADFLPSDGAALTLLLYAVKSGLLLAAAGVVVLLLRSSTAALRHRVWAVAFAGVLVLLPLSLAAPEWHLGIIDVPAAPATVAAHGEIPSQAALAYPEVPSPASLPAVPMKETVSPLPAPADIAETPPVAASPRTASAFLSLLYFWMTGVFAVAFYFGMGTLLAVRRLRDAAEVTDARWVELAAGISRMNGLAGPVSLRHHPGAISPMAWGLVRPVVLLPADADTWSESRRRVVLMHEIAHIARRDMLIGVLSQAVCALHWFNPLVWWASARLRAERERACDDHVLMHGARPSTYAHHLLEIARRVRDAGTMPATAVAMARPSQLEGRLMAILAPDVPRGPGRPALSRLLTLLVAACVLPLAAMSPFAGAPVPLNEPAHSAVLESHQTDPVPETTDEPPAEARSAPQPVVAEPGAAPATTSMAADARVPQMDVLREEFAVAPGGTLYVSSDMGSITVNSGRQNRVVVVVHREAEGDTRPEEFEVRFARQGNDVRVTGRQARRDQPDRRSVSMNVRYEITVPHDYNAELNTAGGSISITNLTGNVRSNTRGGSLSFDRINGTIQGATSGGSVSVAYSRGRTQVTSSGGSITLRHLQGDTQANTTGGSVTIEDVAGNLQAATQGGFIRGRYSSPPSGIVRLATTGGSIDVAIPSGAGVHLDAAAQGGTVRTDFNVPVESSNSSHRAVGPVNGGGAELNLRTSGGSIQVRRL